MLYATAVEKKLLGILKKLQERELFSDLRLVGGTALALQCGHRISVDIDLFGRVNIDADVMSMELAAFDKVQVLNSSSNMIFVTIDGVKVDIVNYRPKWIEEAVVIDGYRMAGLRDIAAMKLSAITNRGRKKDFYDLCELLQHLSLSEMMDAMTQKYPENSPFLTIKSLSYFADAEEDADPESLRKLSWKEVKSEVLSTIHTYLQK